MRVSRGGFASGEKEFVTFGGGLAHSSVMLFGSSVPRILEEGNDDLIRAGACISEYAAVASRPAYRRMTGERSVTEVGEGSWRAYFQRHRGVLGQILSGRKLCRQPQARGFRECCVLLFLERK